MRETPQTLFHIIKQAVPTSADFLSGAQRGQTKPRDPDRERYWHGFSAFNTLDGARNQAQRFRKLGEFIVEIAVAGVVGVQYEQSFGPGHYTVWAEPDTCVRNVIRVYPVWDREEE
ncbi:MAG: hypothetical protein ACR2M3_11095 [Thermomicrobiales bacterium]